MSIIHEALKKAASEGASETSRSISHSHLFRASTQTRRVYRWIAIGISFLVLSGFFFSVQYPFSLQSHLDKSTTPSILPSLESKIESAVPTLDHILAEDKKIDDSESTGILPNSQVEDGERMLMTGIKLYNEGKIEEANSAFTEAVELLPQSAVAHNNLGMVLRYQEKAGEALIHYQEAIRLDPNYAEAENNIGLIYDKTGSIDQAAIHYKRAINIKPAVPVFHLNYATLLERKGDFSNARKEYKTYLELETDQKSEMIPLVRSHLNKLKGFE